MKSGEKRLFLIILACALVLTGVALFPVWQQQHRAAAKAVKELDGRPGAPTRAQILGDARHARGPVGAPFILVEFADYTCAHCADAVPYVDRLVRDHANDLRHVFRCLPITRHLEAGYCAGAAEAAGLQGRFWKMEALLFATPGDKTEEQVDAMALLAGLNMARYRKDISSQRAAALMALDRSAGDALGITTTPTFFFISPKHIYRILGDAALKGFLDDRSHWR